MKPIQYSLICLVLSSALVLTDSAVVQNMFKERLSTVKHIVGKSMARNFQINLENLRTTNSLSCYTTQPDATVKPGICPPMGTECGILSFDVSPKSQIVHYSQYACATKDACDNPDVICQQAAKQLPWPISNCNLKCCKANLCNKPRVEGVSQPNIGSSFPLNLPGSVISSPNPPSNDLSCYVVDESGQPVEESCKSGLTECITVTAYMKPPVVPKVEVTSYGCVTPDLCSNPDVVCEDVKKRLPFPMSNCTVKCCSTNNCNTPIAEKLSYNTPALPLRINLSENLIFSPNSPTNSLSCYVVQSGQRVVSQTCPASATECLRATADVESGPHTGEKVEVLTCASKAECQYPKIVCTSIAQRVPFKIGNCEVKCCSTNNCNTPLANEITQSRPALHLPIDLPSDQTVLNPPANTLSCYTVQSDQSIVTQTCPAQETECLKVTAYVQTPQKSKVEVQALSCVPASVCKNPSAVCQSIAKEIPYPMSDCKVSCCTTNNCNTPDFKKAALSLPDLSVLNPPANTLSCYTVQPDQRIVPKTCPAQETECLKVTAFVQPAGQPKEEVEALSCVPASVCKNREAVCQSIAKEIPYPMSDCKVSCCTTNNCNTPDFESSALYLSALSLPINLPTDLSVLNPPANTLSCYTVQPDQRIVPKTCPAQETECLKVTAFVQPPGQPKEEVEALSCVPASVCKNREAVCQSIAKEVPYPMSDCKVSCCTTNNCNTPDFERSALYLSDLSVLNPPANTLSCYTVQPDQRIVPKTCPAQETECLKVTAFVQPPGQPKEEVEALSCVPASVCENREAVCQSIAKEVPYPMSDCKVSCCTTNNCNTPDFERSALYLPDLSVLNPPANTLSCYTVQSDQSIVTQTCPAQETECLKVTAYVQTPQKSKVEVQALSCVPASVCKNPSAVCQSIAKEIPYPISDCKVSCCTTNNCNTPDFKKAALSLPGLSVLNPPANTLSCYTVQPDQRIVPKTCPAQETECLKVTAFVQPPGQPKEEVEALSCVPASVCENREAVCQSIAKEVPYPMSDCKVSCCTTNNCNTPDFERSALYLSDLSVLNPPANTLSCYTVQPDQSIVPKTCPAQETECLKVTAFVQPPGQPKEEVEALSCVPASVCKNREAVCQSIAKEIPYPMSDCKASCCNTNNCNTPDFKSSALSLPDGLF